MDELFQSIAETPELVTAEVSGNIPEWIRGSLLRNAPGKFDFDKNAYNHWFDGLSLLHAFVIGRGEVRYHSKYLRTQAFVRAEEEKRTIFTEFGTPEVPDPCRNIFSRFFSYFWPVKVGDNTPVNIIKMKGKFFANTDSTIMNEFDPNTLDILSTVDANKDLKTPRKMVCAMAHPHEEPDGSVFHVMTSVGREPRYNIVRVPPEQQTSRAERENLLDGATIVASFPPHHGITYYHSFGITPNYFIFVDSPFTISTLEVLTIKIFQRAYHDCLHWNTEQPSLFYLINRQSGQREATFEADGFFTFHHINAYEDGDEVVVDACCYPDVSIIDSFYLRHLRNSDPEKVSENVSQAEVRRYRLKISGKDVAASDACSTRLQYETFETNMDLPRINCRRNGLSYRFVYGTGPHKFGHFLNQLVKLDTKLKVKKVWYEPDCYPSEPLFVERPGAEDEDDGVILSTVVGTRGQKSFLLVLDARDFTELARAMVPSPLSSSLHGRFFPGLGINDEINP